MTTAVQRRAWQMTEAGAPLEQVTDDAPAPGSGEVTVEVAGCGLCHTDLGFLHGDVRTRADLPLVLGHEIAGTVTACADDAAEWAGREVLVHAVIACGECSFCRKGRGNVCTNQVMPGNDCDGGFASHVTVPARGLTPVEERPAELPLADLAVVADAVTTPYQAVERAGVTDGDLVVVVGAGGVGGFAVQIAAARRARVVAVDVDDARLKLLSDHGAAAVFNARDRESREVRDFVRGCAADWNMGRAGWKVFECSGTTAGQETAWRLLTPAGTLAVVGFTRDAASVRLSNLMAFDADCFGSWGCPPERYGPALDMVLSGGVAVGPFVRHTPLDELPAAIEAAESGGDPRRTVLIP